MDTRQTSDTFKVEGRITATLHDVDMLQAHVDEWDTLSDYQKSLVVRPPEQIDVGSLDEQNVGYALMDVEPTEEVSEFNTTCVGLHEYIVDELDAGQTVDEEASHLALGNDSSSTPSSGDTALNNEVFRKSVTDHADNGTELLCSTFVSSEEANGYTLEELGLYTDDGTGSDILLNHSTFSAVTKDSSKTVTFDVTLSFSAA